MAAVPPLDTSHEPEVKLESTGGKTSPFNIYPLIGIVLTIAAAAVVYGGFALVFMGG